MKTLNEEFKVSCKTRNSKILSEKNNIYKINNFFEDPKQAKAFITGLQKWDCEDLDNHAKPGMEIVFPTWVNDYLTQNIFSLNNIKPVHKTDAIVNMHYYGMPKKKNLFQSSNGTFDLPHHDHISGYNGVDCFVLLVNLNEYEIFTNFWKFKGKELMVDNEFNNFCYQFQSQNENKSLDSLKVPDEIYLYHQAKYKFNEAIIYNASLLHSANVIESYTRQNPRVTLRYMFYLKSGQKLINTNFNYE